MVFNEVALTGWYCAVPGIMIQFIKVFAAFWAKIKRPCKYTKRQILSCFQFANIMKNMHRDADTCSPVKCFKNFSFCRRSLGKTSVKNGEIPQVVNCCTKMWLFIFILVTRYVMPPNRSNNHYCIQVWSSSPYLILSVIECSDAYQECVHADMTL